MNNFGIFDEEFIRGKVPMTKREIRILTLNEARLKKDGVTYDIGAGTGSLSIEAALVQTKGKVYAYEKNPEAVNLIKQNMEKFKVNNIEILEKEAPEEIEILPLADTILIGGSGGRLFEILEKSSKKLKKNGRIIINAITIETVNTAFEFLKQNSDFKYYAAEISISRYTYIGSYHLKKAENPISIVVCEKV